MPAQHLRHVNVRSRQTFPNHTEGAETVPVDPLMSIIIKHPAYPVTSDTLLTLKASDDSRGGIHHDTLLIICGILANNRFDGYLAETAVGPAITEPRSAILRRRIYYFCVTPPDGQTEPYKYPVVPSFSHWRFPHKALPDSWAQAMKTHEPARQSSTDHSEMSRARIARGSSCLISLHEDESESASLCPPSEMDWFENNIMSIYAKNDPMAGLNDICNAIFLRADINQQFEKRGFVIVPKLTQDGKTPWVVHYLSEPQQSRKLYHNVELQDISNLSAEYLFARLAWSVLPLLSRFLKINARTNLLVVVEQGRKLVHAPIYLEDLQQKRVVEEVAEEALATPLAEDEQDPLSTPLAEEPLHLTATIDSLSSATTKDKLFKTFEMWLSKEPLKEPTEHDEEPSKTLTEPNEETTNNATSSTKKRKHGEDDASEAHKRGRHTMPSTHAVNSKSPDRPQSRARSPMTPNHHRSRKAPIFTLSTLSNHISKNTPLSTRKTILSSIPEFQDFYISLSAPRVEDSTDNTSGVEEDYLHEEHARSGPDGS